MSSPVSKGRLEALATRLVQMRLNKNWSQSYLATEAGVSVATLRRLEAGHSIGLASWLAVLETLGLAERLDFLLPPPAADPLAEAERERQNYRRARRRASSTKPPAENSTWTWGEDR
jgi:putative transcriptional regulator